MDHDTLRTVLPDFGLTQAPNPLRVPANKLDATQRQCMKTEGYFRLSTPLAQAAQLTKLRTGIERLVEAGWPPSFM